MVLSRCFQEGRSHGLWSVWTSPGAGHFNVLVIRNSHIPKLGMDASIIAISLTSDQ